MQFGVIFLCLLWAGQVMATPGDRVLPPGQAPNDSRLGPLKSTRHSSFPFTPPTDKDQWARRRIALRQQVLVATGLWPMPTQTPLKSVIYGRIDRDGYTVKKVYFQSLPGFYVTGNLYYPKPETAAMPGVLCPYGHWPQGRFMDTPPEKVRQQISQGAERFVQGGRSIIQSRCVQLARMGCVVFDYDMIGYCDCRQIPFHIAHFYRGDRAKLNRLQRWGLYTAQAGANLQTIMGLQTYNSIRALDFLCSLPEVDPHRIGVTGGSTGGTQTYMLAAVDGRPAVIFPACMVGTAMQGGCTCENAPYLRIGTGNVELTALFAPKPVGLNAADDWTHDMPTQGFPALKKLYTLLGAPQHVRIFPATQFRHNYNAVTRMAMYNWFNRYLHLGCQTPVIEKDFVPLTASQLTVWDAQHPVPPNDVNVELDLLQGLKTDSDHQIEHMRHSLSQYRHWVGGALQVMIGRTPDSIGHVTWDIKRQVQQPGLTQTWGLLHNVTYREAIPALLWQPAHGTGKAVLWLSTRGKAGLLDDQGRPIKPIARLLQAGIEVLAVDLFMQGKFLKDPQQPVANRRVANKYHFEAFTYAYNQPLLAQRVDDILTALTFLRHQDNHPGVALVGLNGTGHWAGLAAALAPALADRVFIDTGGFRFSHLLNVYDADFLPGGAKYGDLPGLLALRAPHWFWLAGEGAAPEIKQLYQEAGHPDHLTLWQGTPSDIENVVIQALLQPAVGR